MLRHKPRLHGRRIRSANAAPGPAGRRNVPNSSPARAQERERLTLQSAAEKRLNPFGPRAVAQGVAAPSQRTAGMGNMNP